MIRQAKTRDTSELVSLMFALGRSMRGEGQKKPGKKSGSLLHFETLRFVKDHNRPLMRDIASHFFITPPAATLLIDGLIQKKMLARVLDVEDRRAVRVRITKDGSAFLAQGIHDKVSKFKKMFSALNPKERAQLTLILKKMAKSMGQL